MDKRIIAIILALIVAVPAAVCMAQYDSEAADPVAPTYDDYDEDHAVNLGSITLDVGGSMKVDLRNNETAYAGYTYEMSFMVKNGEQYTENLGTFKSEGSEDSPVSAGVDVADRSINLKLERDGGSKTGEFTITATGSKVISGTQILIECTVSVTPKDSTGSTGAVSDKIYYELSVTVVDDGSIKFTSQEPITIVAGELVGDNVTLGISEPTVAEGMTVYAYGLPAGINVVISDRDVKLTGMTSDAVKDYSVTVVLRDASGLEYRGSLTVRVTEAPSIAYTAVLEDSKDGGNENVKGFDGNYTIFYGAAENVTLKITGTAQAFGGSVFIYQQDGDSISTPVPADENTGSDGTQSNVTTYTIPVGGIGSYIIEILNVDGNVVTVTLTVLPVSTGSVGLIVIGN